MKTGRLHIRLAEADAELLRELARARGTTVSSLIREMAQRLLQEDRERALGDRLLSIEPGRQA